MAGNPTPGGSIAAQRQFLVRVSGINDYFSTKTGGGLTADASREFDGGSLVPEVLAGPAIPGDLTIGRPWKPERDADVLARLTPLVGRWRTSIRVQPTDRDLVAVGKARDYSSVLLIGINDPEANASSGDAARLELTFAVEQVK